MPFVIWHLEGHLLPIDKIVTFSFLAKVPWQFPQKCQDRLEPLSFSVNNFVKGLVTSTRTLPEFDGITDIGIEEFSKFIGDWGHMNLKRIWYIIKNFPNRIHYNYNFPDALKIGGLIYTTSYSKQFSFSRHDIDHMMNHFDDLFVVNIDMSDRSSNLVLYAGIRYYKSN